MEKSIDWVPVLYPKTNISSNPPMSHTACCLLYQPTFFDTGANVGPVAINSDDIGAADDTTAQIWSENIDIGTIEAGFHDSQSISGFGSPNLLLSSRLENEETLVTVPLELCICEFTSLDSQNTSPDGLIAHLRTCLRNADQFIDIMSHIEQSQILAYQDFLAQVTSFVFIWVPLLTNLKVAANSSGPVTSLCRRWARKVACKTEVLPSKLFIDGVEKEGDMPAESGGFADIYCGTMNGSKVALKVLRYCTKQSPVHKAGDFSPLLTKVNCRESLDILLGSTILATSRPPQHLATFRCLSGLIST
jgi:hypothetical protein